MDDRVQAATEADIFERLLALLGRDAEPDTRLVLSAVRRTSCDGEIAAE